MQPACGQDYRLGGLLPDIHLYVEQVQVVFIIHWHAVVQMCIEQHAEFGTIGSGSDALRIFIVVIASLAGGDDGVGAT